MAVEVNTIRLFVLKTFNFVSIGACLLTNGFGPQYGANTRILSLILCFISKHDMLTSTNLDVVSQVEQEIRSRMSSRYSGH